MIRKLITGKHSKKATRRQRFHSLLAKSTAVTAIALIVAIVASLAASGITYAWLHTSDSVENEMAVGLHKVIVSEKFDPPAKWNPGNTTTKEVDFYNSGDTGSILRVSYAEQWTSAAGATLSNTFIDPNTGLPADATVKNWANGGFSNSALWVDGGDGYFYYKKVLMPGEYTGAVLNSITFNPVILQTNTAIDYLGGSYRLTFFVESVDMHATPEAIQAEFGRYVSAAIDGSSNVTWSFMP